MGNTEIKEALKAVSTLDFEEMKQKLETFELKRPEIIFEWKDKETDAEGWVVINSLKGGAAGGGTRMRKGLDRKEVEALAKTMEVKFTVSGPAIGGAKSGINFDPSDPRKQDVLRRWYKAIMPLLKSYYGTGGDLNVDEKTEVKPMTEFYGLWHPQEGVLNGHYNPRENEKIYKIGQLRVGVAKIIESEKYSPSPEKKYTVSEMITGYGVAESIKHYYEIYGGGLKDKRVLVQGWGNVGAAAGFFLSQSGAKIVGIIDKSGGLINNNGFSHEEVRSFFVRRKGNTLDVEGQLSFEQANTSFWDTKADIFIPAAASRLITKDHVSRLIQAGVELIACGANVPFNDPEIFIGPVADMTDNRIAVIPDFISNCGMARTFAYLMGNNVEVSDDAIFSDVSSTIKEALQHTHDVNPAKIQLTKTAFSIALNKLI